MALTKTDSVSDREALVVPSFLPWLSSDSSLRGKQFEQVAAWWLRNDPIWTRQIKNVWLWADWPNRHGPDTGVDLVAEQYDGSLVAVQCKAYSESTPITKSSIDSFISASPSPQFAHRVLLATTNRIGRNARKTLDDNNVGMFLLDDLARWEGEWPRSTDAIQQSFARPKPFPPLPHQSDAVEAIVQGLSKESRGTAVKACGTGKTLTALWTFERLDPAVTVVVVPSLNLLKQTLEEWSRHSSLEWRFLCVCSDESVLPADDTPVGRTSELGVPVTTDVTEIRAFLQRPIRKVIFSTYQSSERIGEALISEAQKADLVICDEAHRLVG